MTQWKRGRLSCNGPIVGHRDYDVKPAWFSVILEGIFSTDGPGSWVLDMANSYASSATVRGMVSFYPVDTDDTCSSSGRTSAIHTEKFNVLLSGDEHNDLFNFVKHLKTFTGLAEITKSKYLRENPEVRIAISCSFIILRYTLSYFSFIGTFQIHI